MASYTWKGVSGDWNLASDWRPAGGPPKSTNSATINGAATTTITVDTADAADSLTLSDANATLNDDGASASLTIGGALTMTNGTLNISPDDDGGVLTVGALNLSGGALNINSGGQLNLKGTLSQTGGGQRRRRRRSNSTTGTLTFTNSGGTLSGVTYEGPLNLTANYASVSLAERNDHHQLVRLGARHHQRHRRRRHSLFRQHPDGQRRHDRSERCQSYENDTTGAQQAKMC